LVIQTMKHALYGEDPDGVQSYILLFPCRADALRWYEENNDHWLKQQHVTSFPVIAGPSTETP
jgi:hypothetical protein